MAFKLQKVGLFEVLKSDFGLEVFQRWDKCLDTSNTSYVMCWSNWFEVVVAQTQNPMVVAQNIKF